LTGTVDPRWYAGFFDSEWLEMRGEVTPPERTQREVEFALEALALPAGARVLDVACGHGRHTLELARRGFRVTGVDLSEPSLALAREAAADEDLDVELVHADMREIPFREEFDAAVNLFTSFGYLESEQEDERALAAIARGLKPGGALLLETINAAVLLRLYRTEAWSELDDGTLMLEQRSYDLLSGRNDVLWRFVQPDGSRTELRHSLRLYTPAEIVGMLRHAGLEIERAWGGWDGSELTMDGGTRFLVLARKAAQP
jgi:SAM-dependent methyltransferase